MYQSTPVDYQERFAADIGLAHPNESVPGNYVMANLDGGHTKITEPVKSGCKSDLAISHDRALTSVWHAAQVRGSYQFVRHWYSAAVPAGDAHGRDAGRQFAGVIQKRALRMRRHMTRRQLMRAGGVTALGATGAAILAACGETQVVTVEKIVTRDVPVEKIVIKEVPVEKIVTKVITKEVPVEVIKEVEAQRRTVKIEFATDHTSGPRGKAMSWGIKRFEQLRPDIKIKYIPQTNIFYEKIGIEAAAGTLSEVNLLNGGTYQRHIEGESWLLINDLLAKNEDHDPDNYWFIPDSYSDNKDESYPYNRTMHGPQHGMPFQTVIGGLMLSTVLTLVVIPVVYTVLDRSK